MLFIIACSTSKNTSMTRMYHNVTALYNVYFNGNEAYQRGINRIRSQHSENYNYILPVFPESNENAASVASSDMDRAINKASKTIKLHSITARPEDSGGFLARRDPDFFNKNEYCKWIDDSYLLMGKAYMIKREFNEARQNFEYVIRQFPNEDTKYSAYLFLARTFIEQGNYSSAREILDMLNADQDFPEKLNKKLNLVYADFYIRQNQYEAAIPKLNDAVDEIRRHKNKVRFIFITAQLHERLGQLSKASSLYEEAARRNPDYEMEFNAKINMANCFIGEGGDVRDIQRTLQRMLRDDKNLDYKDQIYYAIANIYYRAGDIDNAIENFTKSVATSEFNDFQKAISSMKLAEIYLERQNYKKSNIYYDTCMMFLPYNYENYQEVRQRARDLSELAKYVNIVEFQDSVQKIALLSEAERNKIIDQLIAEVIAQERMEREMQRQDQVSSMLFDERRGGRDRGPISSSGQWYMYDPSQLSYGQNAFRQRWGRRQNEDHWRRSNKISMDEMYADFDEEDPEGRGEEGRVRDERSREYYLQDLPLTDSMMVASHERIKQALFNVAKIYQEKFLNYPMAIETYEELNSRYPENQFLLLSYYNLYVLSNITNQHDKKQTYKDLLIAKFPDTHYANMLKNPNYIAELEEKRKRNQQLYIDTYDEFRKRNCHIVNRNADRYIQENPEGELRARFDYLKTLCVGKTGAKTDFQMALVEFMRQYPEDELYLAAQEILQFFGTADIEQLIAELKSRPAAERMREGTGEEIPGLKSPEELFELNEMGRHFYVIKIKSDNVDDRRLSFEVRNFNVFNFTMRTFDVSVTNYDNEHKLIVVKTFNNQRQAINYRNIIANNRDVFGNLDPRDYEVFVISEENLRILNNNKKYDKYMQFYAVHY